MPQALSEYGKRHNPWLYAMYAIMRQITLDKTSGLPHLPINEFESLVDDLGLPELGFSSDYLLNTGTQANFLAASNSTVGPAIRLLGRIAAVSSPAVI